MLHHEKTQNRWSKVAARCTVGSIFNGSLLQNQSNRVFCREYNVKIVFSHDEEGRKCMKNPSKIEARSGTEKTSRNHVKTTKNGPRNASKIYQKSIKNPSCSAGAPGETKSRRRGTPGDTPGVPRGAPGASRRPWRNGPSIRDRPLTLTGFNIRLELARAARALVLLIPDPLTLRRAVIRRAIATSPTRMSTCANVHNMGRSKCCEC